MRVTTTLFTLLIIVLCQPTRLIAQEKPGPRKITLHPSFEPQPAMKYRLLPPRVDQLPGNAAVYYGKVKAEQNAFFSNRALRNNIDHWQEMPLAQLVAEDASVPTGIMDYYFDRGARCRYCDWQMSIGDGQFYDTLLPEIQESRQFSRILAASARIDLAHGRFDDAIWRFQMDYALGRHIAESEFTVGGLVGVAICAIMNNQVMEYVQQPRAPNLYWALTALPTPLINMRDAMELEAHGLDLSYPELGHREGVGLGAYGNREPTHPELWKYPPVRRTPDEWKRLYHAVVTDMHRLIAGNDQTQQTEEEIERNCRSALPLAEKYLVERGMSDQALELMSAHETVLIFLFESFRETVDAMVKYYPLPYPDAIAGLEAVAKQSQAAAADLPEELRAADHLVKVIPAAKKAETRLMREIAALRVLEALRIYGAHHGGKLPEQLSDVEEVPIPDDPVTGEPFVYQLQDEAAFLTGPTIQNVPLNYEITMQLP